MSRSIKTGFSLVEILVAVAIVSVIAVTAIPNLKKFNESIILGNETSKLVQTLRQTQSNAQSGINCPDGKQSQDWIANFSQSTYYKVNIICLDSSGNPLASIDYLIVNLDPKVTVASISCTTLGVKDVKFTKNSVLEKCTVILQNTNASPPTRSVIIDKGGVINDGS